jgi:hypothetical protein
VTLELDERYGRTRGSKSRNRAIAIIVGAIVAVVVVAWVIWVGLFSPAADLNVEDTGHVIVDETTVDVRFQLTVEPGTATRCAVNAMNEGFSIVGWKIIDVPASDERLRALVARVHTTELGVTGLIYRCWLA